MPRKMPMAEFLAFTIPGDQDWSWASQLKWLAENHPKECRDVFWDIYYNGQQEPVLIGDDQRLWDGHHRVYALVGLKAQYIHVKYSWEDQ